MSPERSDHQRRAPRLSIDDGCTLQVESREDDRRQFRKERPEGTFSGFRFVRRTRRGLSRHSTLWTVRESGGLFMDLIEWYCAAGHTIERYPDDGRDRHSTRRRRTRIPPHGGNCPGPWDDERNQWRYECGLPLHHHRVIPD
jgi:hypothetical protein